MKLEEYVLDDILKSSTNSEIVIKSPRFQRNSLCLGEKGHIIRDNFAMSEALCFFARFDSGKERRISLDLTGEYRLDSCPAGGLLLISCGNDKPSYWLPQPPMVRQIDKQNHIISEQSLGFSGLHAASASFSLEIDIPEGQSLDLVIWQIPAGGKSIISDLANLSSFEIQSVFLWGSHTSYQKPADVYSHLINGYVYENRFAWPHKWKICSENDAHALYVTLRGLELSAGKKIYSLLKEQLLISVIARQNEDGGWYHGEWTSIMESHYRLHCSAMHLLMDSLAEKIDDLVQKYLEKAAAFIAKRADRTKKGDWFLHDSLEHSEGAMKRGPFRWKANRLFGKSSTNMMVLNTHLDTTIALDRYNQITGDKQYQKLVISARSATLAVLGLHPAEWVYRPLFWAIKLTLLPKETAIRLSLPIRAIKRLAWKYLIPYFGNIKCAFPRLVMPGGYIDRALSLSGLADDYQSINVMDLLRYQRRFQEKEMNKILEGALEFTQFYGIRKYWAQDRYKKYALGFWAEALYHLCTLKEDLKYRAWLAEAVINLEEKGLGVPPSLLGANSEAVSLEYQRPCLINENCNLCMVNLSCFGAKEYLAINPTKETQFCKFSNLKETLRWFSSQSELVKDEVLKVPPKSWIRGVI